MIEITHKCTDYEDDVKNARALILWKAVILFAPAAFLIILGIILTFVCKKYALLVISILGIIYVPIINFVLEDIFDGLIKTIKRKYAEFYAIVNKESLMKTTIINDNKGFLGVIGKNNVLYCRLENGLMKYVSASFMLEKLKFNNASVGKLERFIKFDFGELVIPVNDIDHYREKTIVCTYGDSVFRMEFKDSKTLETFIPKKEYYYQSAKKD